ARSRRSLFLKFPTAAAVPAPSGASLIAPQCHNTSPVFSPMLPMTATTSSMY
ncbi:hypothetical protein M9458_039703, partial [Cirrhinus mrigala]